MKQKEVTINGKTYPAIFTMKTITGFEEIVEHSFFADDFSKMASRIAIVVAAIVAADINADVSADDILNADKVEAVNEVLEAYTTVMEMAGEFFKVPETEKKNEDEKAEKTDKEKN
jgi:hypothetical protein